MEPLSLADIPAADEALRSQARGFIAKHMSALSLEARARSWLGFDADFSRALGAEGFLGLTVPRRYGGGERGAFSRFVVAEELLAAGAPVSAHWVADRQSAPHILKYGTEAQREFFLPRICRGEAFFCIGMSEPGAGSDLAAVRTKAVRSSGGWVLNGQKVWTTNAPSSHYMIALLRTSGTPEDRHKGLSQMIVALSLPGITVRPIRDLNGDSHFSEVFFRDVELPEAALLGAEGGGWEQVIAELAFERAGPERLYSSIVLSEGWLSWLRSRGCVTVAERTLAGKLATDLATLRNMSISVTALLVAGKSPAVEAALVKDLGTEFEQYVPEAIAGSIGARPDVIPPPPLARALAHITQIAPTFSLRGGTREILRGVIARELGLR
jgi:alkylation response protein AidB-like acyl-CoA dehydrogenase